MRIGVNCFLLQASIGGLKQYFHTLFDELLASDHENEYIFFYFDHNLDELGAIHQRWKRYAIRLTDQREVSNHLDKIDLYFCPFGALWPIPLPIPTVVTIVDLQEKYYPEFFLPMDHWNRDYHYYGSSHEADAVITISEFSKRSIVHFHSVPAGKVHVAYLSPDPRYCGPGNVGQPFDHLPDQYIFYPANQWKHKNHDCLLRALKIIKDEKQLNIPVVFTGFGQNNGYPLKEKIREFGTCAMMFEFLSVEQMVYLYRRAKLLCFPSLFEGFGIPLVEAMYAGCPIVCSNTSSIPEVVGDAAVFFDSGNPVDCATKIFEVWNNPSLRNDLIAKGSERARRFTSARLAQDHLAVFSQASKDFSYLLYLKNKLFFNPMHEFRLKRRLPSTP
jgi:glycosyltransferase involved in cell wall biosynthesis